MLLIPSTTSGRDYGPRVAGELELGMTGDCVDLGIDKAGRLIQYKPAYGGNIISVIMGATTPQLATVRPGIFAPVEPRDDAQAEVAGFEVEPASSLRLVEQEHTRRRPRTSWTPPTSASARARAWEGPRRSPSWSALRSAWGERSEPAATSPTPAGSRRAARSA